MALLVATIMMTAPSNMWLIRTIILMKQIFRSQRVDKLNDQLCDKERHMGEEKKKCSIAARSKAHEMPDEQAEMVLSALLKEV